MFSTAILMKPSATSSPERPSPISRASSAKAVRPPAGAEGKFLRRTKNLGKDPPHRLAAYAVGVGGRGRPAAAVTLRAGIGAGTVGPDTEARAVKMQDRAAARRDR